MAYTPPTMRTAHASVKSGLRRLLLTTVLAVCEVSAHPAMAADAAAIPVTEFARPTLVTLSVRDQSVEYVRNALQKQSGFSIALTGVDDTTFTAHRFSFECKEVPWLEALMRFSDAAHVEPTIAANNRWTLASVGPRHLLGPRDVQGPTMVALTAASIETVVDFGTVEQTSLQLRVNGVLAVEPSLELGDITSITDVRMVDGVGRELAASAVPLTRSRPSSFAHPQRYFAVRAPLPDRGAKSLSLVSGKLTAPAVRKREVVSIPDLLTREGERVAFGKQALTVKSVQRNSPQVYSVDVLIDRPYVPEHVFAWQREDPSKLYVKQSQNADPASVRVQKVVPTDGGMIVTLYVQFNRAASDAGPDVTRRLDLWWEAPSEFGDVSIPFQVAEVLLP